MRVVAIEARAAGDFTTEGTEEHRGSGETGSCAGLRAAAELPLIDVGEDRWWGKREQSSHTPG